MLRQHVLVVDDSPDVHALLRARLQHEGIVLHHESDGRGGIAAAHAMKPDLVLLDVAMPEVSGFEVCRALKASADTANIPVIFLTGTNDTFVKVEAFDLGCVDYVTKPFEPAELRARVRAALRTKRYVDMLAQRAEVDALTGLYNRRNFDRRAAEMLAAARHSGASVGLVMLDIDHFKAINDRHGHPFGDRVMQQLGELLTATIRGDDRAFRYGGEEFVVLADDADVEGVTACARRLAEAVARARFVHNGEVVPATVSCGVASTELFPEEHVVTPGELLAAADNALYEAKRSGRNRTCVAARRRAKLSKPAPAVHAAPPPPVALP